MEGRFFVNPGSVTGALSSGWWEGGEVPVPSFVLMDVSHACMRESCLREGYAPGIFVLTLGLRFQGTRSWSTYIS